MWTLPTILTVARLFAIPPVMWLFTFTTPSAAAWASGIFVVASLTDFLDGYIARKWVRLAPVSKIAPPAPAQFAVHVGPRQPRRMHVGAACRLQGGLGRSCAKQTAEIATRQYCACVQNLSTPFGAFLDPVADKLMVCTVLIMLCTKTFDAGLFAAHPWLLHALASAVIARELAMSALREWAASLSAEARGLVAVNSIGKVKTTLQLVSLAMLLAAMNGGDGALVAACAEAGPWALLAAAGLTVYSFAVYFAALAKFMV